MGGIIHNDVWTSNFLLSNKNQSRILIFDFGNVLMLKDIQMWVNSYHVAHVLDRLAKVWNGIHTSLWNERPEFRHFANSFKHIEEGNAIISADANYTFRFCIEMILFVVILVCIRAILTTRRVKSDIHIS